MSQPVTNISTPILRQSSGSKFKRMEQLFGTRFLTGDYLEQLPPGDLYFKPFGNQSAIRFKPCCVREPSRNPNDIGPISHTLQKPR